ncbi:MAG: deoxyribose-phosphate aldolase [Clostridiales bacterium]|nr:deoxyribose-phosphate aldolase [Clostridiales bacterium]
MKPFNKYFEHTLLKSNATDEDIKKLLDEALKYNFYGVCVNGCHVATASEYLKGSDIKVVTVIGFPLGCGSTASKVAETIDTIKNGAYEIDSVLNVGALKSGRYDDIASELHALSSLCHHNSCKLKLILEICLLTEDEIVKACQMAVDSGVDFVKTSTGFSTGGATVKSVNLMRQTVGDKVGIKAAGGIRTLDDARAFIEAGADRLGCSASVEVLKAFLDSSFIAYPTP